MEYGYEGPKDPRSMLPEESLKQEGCSKGRGLGNVYGEGD